MTYVGVRQGTRPIDAHIRLHIVEIVEMVETIEIRCTYDKQPLQPRVWWQAAALTLTLGATMRGEG